MSDPPQLRALVLHALASGICLAVPFAYPSWWILGFASLALLFKAASAASTKWQAAGLGCLASVCCFAVGTWWLVLTMVVFYQVPPVIAVALFVVFLALSSTKLAILCFLVRHLEATDPRRTLLTWPLALMAAEVVQLSLFPWYFGETQSGNLYLAQAADVVGALGLGFPLAVVAAAIVGCWRRRALLAGPAAIAAGVLVLTCGYGAVRLPEVERAEAAAPPVRVAIVQPNTPLRWSWREDLANHILDTCERLTRQAAAAGPLQLVVWPEGSTPFSYQTRQADIDRRFRRLVDTLTTSLHVNLLFNDDRFENGHRYNSVYLVDAQGRAVANYVKRVLLPFAEYLPGSTWFPALRGAWGTMDFSPGAAPVLLVTDRATVAPQLCYEILLPESVRDFVAGGADCIVNMTDDAWFGRSPASRIHFSGGFLRAVENRRPLVRATNSGISGMVSAGGRPITPATPLFEETWVAADIHPLHLLTFYTRYGNAFGYACTVMLLAWLVRWRKTIN